MQYDFQTQKAIGQAGEDAIAQHLSQQFVLTKATPALQHVGIDFVGINKTTAEVETFEVKTDSVAYRTGNAFIETISRDKPIHFPGWAFTCTAEWLLYYLPQPQRIYRISPSKIRLKLPIWEAKYPIRMASNATYNTIGRLVPLSELKAIAAEIFTLQ